MDEQKLQSDEELSCGMAQTPTAYIVAQLRLMMDKAEGEDKCTLCRAAEALEKSNGSWSSSFSWIALLMLLFGSGFGSTQNDSMMQAYLEALKKCNENSDDK